MKQKQKFRAANVASEPLAFDPQAFGFMFDSAADSCVEVTRGGTAIVSIEGPLDHKAGWFFDSYEAIRERFESALADPEVLRVVLKIDSPGGECAGCFETVEAMRASAAESGKQVVTFVDESAYSAGYALACVGETIVIPKTGGVGSVGVLQIMVDATKMDSDLGLKYNFVASGSLKADGNPHAGISDEIVTRAQTRVDELAGMFFDLVAGSRGVDASAIKALQAGCFYGQEAISKGLADEVMSFDQLIATLEGSTSEPEPMQTTGDQTMKLKTKAAKAIGNITKIEASVAEDDEKKVAAEEEEKKAEAAPEESKAEFPVKEDDEEEDEGDAKKESALGVEDVIAAISHVTGKTSPVDMIAAVHAMAAQASKVKKVSADAHKTKVEALIEAGAKDGKLPPSSHAYWRSVAMKGADGLKILKGHLESMGSVVTVAGEGAVPSEAVRVAGKTPSQIVSGQSDLSPEALQIAKDMKVSADDLRKAAASVGLSHTGKRGISNPLHAVK